MWIQKWQDSPPAWTQEAYRPPCSECSFCCPTWVPPPGGGTQTHPPRGTPLGGTQSGTPPGGTRTPPGGPVRYPPGGGTRTPPAASWHSGKCCKALWDMGTPPVDRQIDGWTDACQNITFPRTTYAGGNNEKYYDDSKRGNATDTYRGHILALFDWISPYTILSFATLGRHPEEYTKQPCWNLKWKYLRKHLQIWITTDFPRFPSILNKFENIFWNNISLKTE